MEVAGFWWHWLSAQYPELQLEDAAPLKHGLLLPSLIRMSCRDRAMEGRCWNRAGVEREALREELHSDKDTRTGNASGAEAWIMWSSWASSESVPELGLGPRLLTCQRNEPRTEQAGVGDVPHLLNLHSIISWLSKRLDMTTLELLC